MMLDARESPHGERAEGPPATFFGRLLAGLQSALSKKSAPWLVIGFSLLLASPSLASGITGDDYFHRLLLKGIALPGVHGRAADMFVFSTGEFALGQAQKAVGMVGWWANP